LGREHLRKGDFISLGVTIGRAGGEEVKSDAVVVGNTPPLLDWVEIKPGQPNSGDTLEAVVHGKDRDGDQLSYDHRWTVNGETVVGEHGASLEQRHFRRGDRVRLFVTPFDGTDSGREVGSPSVVIRDSAPKVISAPPEHLESTSYRYEVRAEDLDGDLLRFSLQGNVPPGMKIDEKTGVVDWQAVDPKEATTWEYEVVVQDPEGLKSVQKITLKYAPP